MTQQNRFKSLLAAGALMTGACDGLDDERSLEPATPTAGRAADEAVESHLGEAPSPSEPEAPDLIDPQTPSAGPAGLACCANCGDFKDVWYNVGYADECNHEAAHWCINHGYTLIDAQWRTPKDDVYCY